jgi:hypothetical protein
VSASTPGQAAYEAYWRCAAAEFGPDVDDAAPSIERWDTLPKWQQRAWEAAAREPHAAHAVTVDTLAAALADTRPPVIIRGIAEPHTLARPYDLAVQLLAALGAQPEPQPAPELEQR